MTYTIRKGNHSCYAVPLPHSGRVSKSYTVTLDPSCWYEPLDWENDSNKLLGWSYGLLPYLRSPSLPWWKLSSWEPPHHKDSMRISWLPTGTRKDPKADLILYRYENKLRIMDVLCTVRMGIPFVLTPRFFPEHQHLAVNTQQDGTGGFIHVKTFSTTLIPLLKKWGWNLYFYFGGDEPAPHKMKASITSP